MSTTRDRPRLAVEAEKQEDSATTQLELENTTVIFEYGTAGVIARIEPRASWRPIEYAGPLSNETLAALREVSQ